jgi:hypothetical protein
MGVKKDNVDFLTVLFLMGNNVLGRCVGALESVANGASFGGNLGFWVLKLRLWGVKLKKMGAWG